MELCIWGGLKKRLGCFWEGSIEKCNQGVKKANSRFVARTSVENMHQNTLVLRSWEADPVLHYEGTVKQVLLRINCFIYVRHWTITGDPEGQHQKQEQTFRGRKLTLISRMQLKLSNKYMYKWKCTLLPHIHLNMLSEIIGLEENGCCGGNLARISSFHFYQIFT